MPRFFTLQQAQELIPQLESWLRAALEAKSEAQEVDQELSDLSTRIALTGGIEIDPWATASRKADRSRATARFKEAMESIGKTGCLVKDLDTGLLDFPALLENQEVYLCWRLGEEQIEYWHHVDAGVAGRRPITGELFGSGENPKPN